MKIRMPKYINRSGNAAIAIAILIGLLGIQLHSFTHHHPDGHNSHHTEQQVDVFNSDQLLEAPEDETLSADCISCVLVKHSNSVFTQSNYEFIAFSNDNLLCVSSSKTLSSTYSHLRLRGPPFVV